MARARPKGTLSSTQLTIEKLISKGRVLTMANQVLAVNISEEVSSTNQIWNEWTNGGDGDDWPVVWPLLDLPLCSEPHGGQALGGATWEAGTDHIPLLGPNRQGGVQRCGGWLQGQRGGAPWGPEAGAVLPERAALPGKGKRRWPAGWAVGVRAAAGPGGCQAGPLVHWALPQGRILLGPEGLPLRRVDVLASNGVIHMLEGVLLPPTILPILPKHCSEEQHQIVAVSTRHVLGARACLFSSSGQGG